MLSLTISFFSVKVEIIYSKVVVNGENCISASHQKRMCTNQIEMYQTEDGNTILQRYFTAKHQQFLGLLAS